MKKEEINTMKGGERENMEKENVTISVFYEKCPICSKKIKGYSENQVKYNLRLHLEKHSKNPNNKE